MRPQYFYSDGKYDDSNVEMLYAAYHDKSYFAVCNEWVESGNGLAWWQSHSDYHPCSLADVRAAFGNIKAHKRSSNNPTQQ